MAPYYTRNSLYGMIAKTGGSALSLKNMQWRRLNGIVNLSSELGTGTIRYASFYNWRYIETKG